MGLAIQLKKLQMFRDWLQHQQEYEGRDQEAEQWEEFIQMMESDKALNRLAESYGAESFNVEFNEWAEQEMKSHGKDISFKDWSKDEGMKHGNTDITEWAQHEDESHDARYGAEGFCAECGSSHKDAETFSAETADGNQVFNSCWKCGSGQHLYQISRYPASPQEIAGVGADPESANTDWQSGRPTQR